MNMKLVLLGDRIAIKPFDVKSTEEEKGSNLLLPNGKKKEMAFTYNRNPFAGIVVAVGDGIVSDHTVDMIAIQQGDIVIIDRPQEFDYGKGNLLTDMAGETSFIIRRSNVIAVIKTVDFAKTYDELEEMYNQINKKDEKI